MGKIKFMKSKEQKGYERGHEEGIFQGREGAIMESVFHMMEAVLELVYLSDTDMLKALKEMDWLDEKEGADYHKWEKARRATIAAFQAVNDYERQKESH